MAKSKKTTENALTIHIVLDRSGSMQSVKDDTIGAFNEYVKTVAKESPESRLSLTIFDTQSVDTIIDNEKITDVRPLTTDSYQPRGGTPLYDAIGKVVPKLATAGGKKKALVILTDGQENSSTEYNKDSIKKLLDERQERDNWLVIYLGANQDAFHEGAKFGTSYANTMTFHTSNLRSTLASTANATLRYGATGDRTVAAFSDSERAEATSQRSKKDKEGVSE